MKYPRVRDWLARNTDLEPDLLGSQSLVSLIAERIKKSPAADEASYLEWLRRTPEETDVLIGSVAVPETWLFRYPKSFDALSGHLASLRSRRGESGDLRMLSVACATGQEPCSMVITAAHAGWPIGRVVVDAIDRDSELIETAKRGVYSPGSIRNELPEWASPWITTSAKEVRVSPEILERISYHCIDALGSELSPIRPPYDVVFCRNLLIYLNRKACVELLGRLASWVAPDGLLFVGHAEHLAALDEMFEPLSESQAFAFRRASGRRRVPKTPSPSRHHPRQRRPQAPMTTTRASVEVATRRRPVPTVEPPPTPVLSLADARLLADSGKLEAALEAGQAVLAADGPSAAVMELIGSVQLALGHTEEATDFFRKAVYLEPNNEPALLQLALISEKLGTLDQARRYRRRARRAHRLSETVDGGHHA
jgi:chemotaxis protein methyltransferase WspC